MCSRPTDDGSEPNSQASLNRYRLHLYNYALQAERLRLSASGWGAVCPAYPTAATGLYPPRFPVTLFHPGGQNPDEPKPQHSYIGLIAMAILQSSEGKLVLSDIYQYILDNYPYFRTRGPGWRNSIRHNLSLNDCFVKAGRSANGKGHYWAIHPANVDDFKKGDFRRRKAQRKVRRHMGLSVDDDGNDSPSPPPPPSPSVAALSPAMWPSPPPVVPPPFFFQPQPMQSAPTTARSQKRQFDVASLLAPDPPKKQKTTTGSSDEDEETRTWEPSLLQRYYEQQLQAAHRLQAFRQTLGLQRMIGPWSGVIVDRNRTPTPPPQQFTTPSDPIKTEIVD